MACDEQRHALNSAIAALTRLQARFGELAQIENETRGFHKGKKDKMTIKLLAMISVVGWLGACATEPVNPDTSESESELAMETKNAPPAIAGGLVGQETDEFASDEVAGPKPLAALGPFSVTVFCSSGWPGTRGCAATIETPTDIIPLPGFPFVQVTSGNGDLGHSATQTGPRSIVFVANVAEGDIFNPGKNSTQYSVLTLIN